MIQNYTATKCGVSSKSCATKWILDFNMTPKNMLQNVFRCLNISKTQQWLQIVRLQAHFLATKSCKFQDYTGPRSSQNVVVILTGIMDEDFIYIPVIHMWFWSLDGNNKWTKLMSKPLVGRTPKLVYSILIFMQLQKNAALWCTSDVFTSHLPTRVYWRAFNLHTDTAWRTQVQQAGLSKFSKCISQTRALKHLIPVCGYWFWDTRT